MGPVWWCWTLDPRACSPQTPFCFHWVLCLCTHSLAWPDSSVGRAGQDSSPRVPLQSKHQLIQYQAGRKRGPGSETAFQNVLLLPCPPLTSETRWPSDIVLLWENPRWRKLSYLSYSITGTHTLCQSEHVEHNSTDIVTLEKWGLSVERIVLVFICLLTPINLTQM